MIRTTIAIAALLAAIGCGKKDGGNAGGSTGADDSSKLTLDKAELTKATPEEACVQLYRKLDTCRAAFNRRVTAVTALDLGPDDAHAQAWVIDPMTVKASAGLCKDEQFTGVVTKQIESCYSNDCDQLARCMMPGTAHELDCPDGTRTMIRKREERLIAWCVRDDGTPHGPMLAAFGDEVRITGQFEDGARTGTWRWPTRDAEVSYQNGKPIAHNGTAIAELPEPIKSSRRLLAMNVVGPEEVLAKGPIKAQPMAVLQGDDLFATCMEQLASRSNYAEGQVRVSFTITPERKADAVTVEAFDPQLADCWKNEILGLDYSGDYGDTVADTDPLHVRAAWGIRAAP
jgi:hypothetical protein